MLDYLLDISPQSVWTIATPGAAALSMPFYLTEIGLFYAHGGYYTSRSDKEGYYLLYTKSGLGTLVQGESEHNVKPGEALLIACREPHRYGTASTEDWVNYWIHLGGPGVESYCSLLESRPVALPEPEAFESALHRLLEAAPRDDVAGAAQESHGLSGLLTAMLDAQAAPLRSGVPHSGIRAAVSLIREHYAQPISIDDITRSAGLSKYHFVRVFRRYMGITPYQYLINYRIHRSKELLCTTDLSVAQIALRTGYQSESNFIQQFGRFCGMTPAQFRRRNLSYLRAD